MVTTTIPIVDDGSSNLSLLTNLLPPLYQARPANSGENALRPTASVPQAHLVLLDVMRAIADQYKDMVNLKR